LIQQPPEIPGRLFAYSLGFWRQSGLRDILRGAGHSLHLGRPSPGDGVVVWGRGPYAHRGEAVAARYGAPLILVEESFLRGIRPGRGNRRGPLGLLIDPLGVHYDSSAPSLLEHILKRDPLDDAVLLQRARDGMARLHAMDLSKYNLHDPALPLPAPGYVLVVDQTLGDASITHGGADAARFGQMLFAAMDEHPNARIIIKAHPETALGLRRGHFTDDLIKGRISLLTDPVSPRALLDGAIAVYTVSSQLGFEAILAGHRPRVFGQPFYAGWGLTADEAPPTRRGRNLSKTQLFAGAMILAPVWHDPCLNRPCTFEQALDQLESEVRAFREDRHGHLVIGFRRWKNGWTRQFFGGEKAVLFPRNVEKALTYPEKPLLLWGITPVPAGLTERPLLRVEDGFLRSRGLGAELLPALSLMTDPEGPYFNAGQPSLIERRLLDEDLTPGQRQRAQNLIRLLRQGQVNKYNLGGAMPPLPDGHKVLVVGQVADDAGLLYGFAEGPPLTNLDLLRRARAARPDACLIWKPHPDVEAGLRQGGVAADDLPGLADITASNADPLALIDAVDEVWTLTSLLGFEALIRGKPVTCLGAPFYAGWGLTTDLGAVPLIRRQRPDGSPQPRPDLAALVHAAMIRAPRYRDPVTGLACPPEVIIHRLTHGPLPQPGRIRRGLYALRKMFRQPRP
jgi:capsular polysaccharide export protein